MAKIISAEKSPFMNKAAEIYSKQKTSQFSKYLQKNPVFVTYYAINQQLSRADTGTGSVKEQIGTSSPIRYNEIKEFPVYNLSDMKPDIQNDETEGLDINMDLSGIVILPNTITPCPDDFLYVKMPGMSYGVLLRVTEFEFNSIQSNDYYTINCELRATDTKSGYSKTYIQLQKQVVEKYSCIFENIGTEDKCLIQDTELAKANSTLELINLLKDSFYDTYYDRDIGTFVYRDFSSGVNPIYYYDLYLIKFIIDSKIYDDVSGERCVTLSLDDVLPINFGNLYRRSLWYAILQKDVTYLSRYSYYTEGSISKVTSPFKINECNTKTIQLTYKDAPIDSGSSLFITGYISEYFPIELTNNLKDKESYTPTYLDEIIFNYILYGNMEIDKNRLANENLHSSLRNYRYIPILIYILEKSYSSVFAS